MLSCKSIEFNLAIVNQLFVFTAHFNEFSLVNVKWGKQTFSNVECDPSQDVMTFRAILYALSCVPVDKQKIMVKGKMVKDEDDLTKLGLKNGMTIMLMGTAEEQGLKEPDKPI